MLALCIWGLAALTCLLCLLLPRMDGDAAVYALIAKNMVLTGDWTNLYFQGKDWLDKPHLPFWLVAGSFELFGVNERAYLLPGLLFYLLGAWATYRLARHFYAERRVALVATLLYLSLLGPLLAASDQKAEVYLLGLLPSASYAWLKFERRGTFRWGLLGALFTACALMTKGVFVLLLVGSGLVALLLWRRDWAGLFHWKWLAAAAGCLLFLMPELASLYLQFDAHPEKQLFGRDHVSGVRFFFWDGQFGRFLNTGPIQNEKGSPWFFFHNLLWTFFPWVLALLAAAAATLSGLSRRTTASSTSGDGPATTAADGARPGQEAQVFLWTMFLTSFALFSATAYQMDYYLVIAFPYAAILCARWLVVNERRLPRWWLRLHVGFCAFVLLLVIGLGIAQATRGGLNLVLPLLFGLGGIALATILRRPAPLVLALVLGATSAMAAFAFAVQVQRELYLGYNGGRQTALYLNAQAPQRVFLAAPDLKTFNFLSRHPVTKIDDGRALAQALSAGNSLYLVAVADQIDALLAGAPPSLRVEALHDIEELDTPKQFLGKVLKDDRALPRRTIRVLRLSTT
ncbi:ArnT family glycosyltransferase [Rivibacter subsaxonicus]|uniref:4-amino-4-deoxy-L-arabinose transferase-like glycosyltransferase n=1 Tax=Rivibacter subsaxonicus TaxID=457575 RepID=A0A4Q7W0P5_9BURK|nr:glycosyltransferase family 39 protein [Rivibacter subsaxonicus]RZU02757.1 4-amino-4-deoxy-L-arabinose transferase-like glycosyltransferase [Rivibacter subsaxonicus]